MVYVGNLHVRMEIRKTAANTISEQLKVISRAIRLLIERKEPIYGQLKKVLHLITPTRPYNPTLLSYRNRENRPSLWGIA